MTIGYLIVEACMTIVIKTRNENNFAVSANADVTILGKPVNTFQDQNIAIGVCIIGKQQCRINDNRLIFNGHKARIINCHWRVKLRNDV